MKNIILPIQKTNSLYKTQKIGSSPMFDPMAIAGNAETVSACPNGWSYINDMTDVEVTELQKPSGKFVDISKMMNEEALDDGMRRLLLSAEKAGLVTFSELYRVNYSEDGDQLGSSSHRTYEDAMNVAFGNDSLISSQKEWVGTRKLAEQLGISEDLAVSKGDTYAVIAMIEEYSKKGMPIDGIYWKEDYNPSSLKSPFMAIFPHKTQEWSSHPCPMPASDEELMKRLPKITNMNLAISAPEFKASDLAQSM